MVFSRKAVVVLLTIPLTIAVLSPGGVSATSPSGVEGDGVSALAFAEECPKPAGEGSAEDRYRQLAVTTAYCIILHRQPEDEGMQYWLEQMSAGLSPVGLVGLLLESAEYQQKSAARSYKQSFTALASSAAKAGRLSISDEAFESWVAARKLQNSVVVTQALVYGQRSTASQQVNVAYVHLSNSRGMRVSPGDRDRSTVGSWAEEIGADVAVNGNWYNPYDGPAVSRGSVYGGDDHDYTALFGMTADNQVIVEHHRQVNATVDPRVTEAVSGHPTLIDGGAVTADFGGDPSFTARHPRTAIGVDQSGDVLILVTVDGRRTSAQGMTGAETATLMQSLGAHDAVMLDGGGSSTMWVAGRGVVNQPSGPLRAVGNQLAVFGR